MKPELRTPHLEISRLVKRISLGFQNREWSKNDNDFETYLVSQIYFTICRIFICFVDETKFKINCDC